MKKISKQVNVNDLIILIIILIVAITSLIIYIKATSSDRKRDLSYPNEPTVTSENKTQSVEKVTYTSSKEDVKKYLSTLGEASRMKYYCGEYIKLIKHEEDQKAYELLYDEFKQNYFPTFEEYEKYVKSFYPVMFAVQYDDISRQGDLYVLRLKIIDANNSKEGNEIVQRFVIRESDYDDFVLSFQVKE